MYKLSDIIILSIVLQAFGHDFKGFDDTLLYNINWKTTDFENDVNEITDNQEHMIVTTTHREKYKCMLPDISEKENSNSINYTGPTPIELLEPLFSQTSCSYRIESYWTYEVCHGKFVRQYHEEREGKKVKLQEYILGQWDKTQLEVTVDALKMDGKTKDTTPIPGKKIEGVTLPYFEISMGNGTVCDLNNNKPRQTKIIYVCQIHGKNNIYSLKETSTCQYEFIILSPFLCAHPKYKPQESGENQINCVPIEGSAQYPYSLLKMRADSKKYRKSEMDHIRLEIVPLELSEKEDTMKAPETPIDMSPVESFLAGKNCLNGGTGWWKYEFCYGKSVEQYHIEKDGSKTSINLGLFDKAKHLEWIAQHPLKRPKPLQDRTMLSHLYSGGSICDKTGKPRQTEVKLKCLDNTSNMNAVSLYLLEPKYCEYILGVESPLICDILARADENGLVDTTNESDNTDDVSTINIRV